MPDTVICPGPGCGWSMDDPQDTMHNEYCKGCHQYLCWTLSELLKDDEHGPFLRTVLAVHDAARPEAVNVVFDGPPGPECGRFVECETDDGNSISIGQWSERDDGLWSLRIPLDNVTRLTHLEALCADLVGEETLHQDGTYKTEMRRLHDHDAERQPVMDAARKLSSLHTSRGCTAIKGVVLAALNELCETSEALDAEQEPGQ